ncbi:MAG: glycosyltransferase, partial [Myxococcota bacterium]
MSTTRNAWPCSRCGHPIAVAPRAGRLPVRTVLALSTALALFVLGLVRPPSPSMSVPWQLTLVALLLLVPLTQVRRRHRAWRCPACGLRQPPRQRHTGPVSVAIAVPTYNNATTIHHVLEDLRRVAPETPLVVIDDGSTDATAKAAKSAAIDPPCVLLSHPRNRGKGAAITTALQWALGEGYSHLVTFDADSQHLADELPQILAAASQQPTAIVVGARDLTGEHVAGSSRFGRSFSNFWLAVQTGVRLADTQSGLRAYPVAPTLTLGCRARRYDFEVEVLTLGARAGLTLRTVPVRVHYPPRHERVSHFRHFWDNARISWVNTRLLVAMPLWPLGWPLRLSRLEPPSALRRSWSGQSRGGALGHLFFLFVLKVLGRRVAYLWLYPVALYFMIAARRQVRTVQRFLDRAAGPAHSRLASWRRSLAHVLCFSQSLVDRGLSVVRGAKSFTWDSEGTDYVVAHRGAKRGVILLSAHLGNYELAGACYGHYDLPINVVMLDGEAQTIKRVYRWFAPRGVQGPRVIATNRGEFPSLQVLAALRAGEAVALHGDRIVDERWVWCDFLGAKAAFP